jgi:nucleoside-diphosphate-sugar epimerase
MKSIVILGGAGFLGSHLTEQLLKSSPAKLIIIDSLSESLYDSIERKRWLKSLDHNSIEFLSVDYASDQAIQVCSSANTVVNLAATAGLRKSWESPMEILSENFLKFFKLIESLSNLPNPPFLIHASTSSVYGESAVGDENSIRRPISPYGVSKLAAELCLEALPKDSRLKWCVLRFFSIYGPRQREDMAYQRLIKSSITGTPFYLFGDGEQKRSNTFASDAAKAIRLCIDKRPNRIALNVAGKELNTLNHAIQIIESFGNKINIIKEGSFRGDQKITEGSAKLAKSILGWQAETSLREGLSAQFKYVKDSLR